MNIQSILVATDLSAHEDIAVQRAMRLADTHRAAVKLMYLPPRGQAVPRGASRGLANAALDLEASLDLRVRAVPVTAHTLEDLAAQAKGMDLVVLPHRRERSTAAFFRGQPVQRLLRSCTCPVLVTRKMSGGHYRRILVAVDFSTESASLVKLGANLDARAELELFHAISTLGEARLRSADAAEHAIRAYRERCLRYAQDCMLTLTDSCDARGNQLLTVIGWGDPGRQTVLQQERSGADLVVLGTRRTSAWEDFFCGSVAHRVLSWGSSDVLLVPQTFVQASAPVAARRMKTGLAAAALQTRPAGRRAS
jgi:nucleotide-binding universal stress UspA family protein